MKDICKNRHRGNLQSIIANTKVDKIKDRLKVYELIVSLKKPYSKYIARMMGKQLNCISGRLSELKRDEIIEVTGETIEGCSVYQLKGKQLRLF